MERVQEELLCFSTILKTISHSVRTQFGVLESSSGKNLSSKSSSTINPSALLQSPGSDTTENNTKHHQRLSADNEDHLNNNDDEEQHALSLDETIELLDLAGQLLESDNNSYRIRALLLETRPNLVEVLVGILVSNPLSILPPSQALGIRSTSVSNPSTPSAAAAAAHQQQRRGSNVSIIENKQQQQQHSRSQSTTSQQQQPIMLHLAGANSLRQEHEHVQRRFVSLQWKAMSNLARACALAAPTDATASQFGFVLDSFDVLNIALRYLVMDEAGLSLRTCAAEVLFLCATKLQLAEQAAQSNETIDAIIFQLAESDHAIGGSAVLREQQQLYQNNNNNNARSISVGGNSGGSSTEDTLRCYLVGTLHALGPVERLLSADFMDVAIGILRDGPIYACTKILELLAQLFKRNPYFVPSSLPSDRVLLFCETLGAALSRLSEHSEVVVSICKVIEICAITSALAVEDDAIVKKTSSSTGNGINNNNEGPFGPRPPEGHKTSMHHHRSRSSQRNASDSTQAAEEGPGRFITFFCHEGQTGPWRKLLIAGKTDPSLVFARAQQMRAMRVLIQCLIDVGTMQRLADELGRDLPLFSALLSAPLRLPPFHDENGHGYVCEASLCLTFLMAKVPSFRANVRRAVATFPAWLQNLEQRLVEGMEAGLQNVASEISAIQLVDVCGNLLNSTGFVDRFAPRAWADVNALEVCVSRLFEFQLRVDPHEPRPTLSNTNAADDDGAPFVAVFVDVDRKSMVLTTGVLAYAICLSFQEIVNDKKYYDSASNSFLGGGQPATTSLGVSEEFEEYRRTFSTDPSLVANSLSGTRLPPPQQQQQQQQNSNNNNNEGNSRFNQQQPIESNFVATDGVEVRTDASESRGTSEQSNLLHFASNAANNNNNNRFAQAKPSPYSLHAMKVRGDSQQPQSHQHQPSSTSVNSAFARTNSNVSSSMANYNNNNMNTTRPNNNFNQQLQNNTPGGFVQRNAVGRFEPVEVIQQQQPSSAHNSLERGVSNLSHHQQQQQNYHQYQQAPPPPAQLLPSHNSFNNNNNNNRPRSTSRPGSRKATPTRSGPVVAVQQDRWK